METETEEEYLLVCDESSSFSSSVSLSDRSTDNIIEEYHSEAPFAGWLTGNIKLNTIQTKSSSVALFKLI